MTRLEAFRKTAAGAAMAAVLAASAAPAAAQTADTPGSSSSALAARRAVSQERKALMQQRRFAREERRTLMRKLARHVRVLEDTAERIERRSLELESLMAAYRTMADDLVWTLREAGGEQSAEERLMLASNVMAKHLAVIDSSGISAIPEGGLGGPEGLGLPATPQGIEASGYGFLEDLQRRIEGLVTEATVRSMEVYVEEGRAADIESAIGVVMSFAAGIEDDVKRASESLEDFREATGAPAFR